jgi:hypothetical protein
MLRGRRKSKDRQILSKNQESTSSQTSLLGREDDNDFIAESASVNGRESVEGASHVGDCDHSPIKKKRGHIRKQSLASVSEIEKLAQKAGTNNPNERFKVKPDYAYPHTRLNREELRLETNKTSSYFHNLRQASRQDQEIGSLSVEMLQCFGLPRTDLLKETSNFCMAVCGSNAFRTDVMPPVANPMWLCRMRRACVFPLYQAYARLFIGVFSKYGDSTRDAFAGRIVVDVARLRPGSTYDFTLPLRQSNHSYSKEQRGAVRVRIHLDWLNERQAVLSYLPTQNPKLQPNEDTFISCCDAKAFQNVARVVHGTDMPGKFSMSLAKATSREMNFVQIHLMRYVRKREFLYTMTWENPVISGFCFFAWMHSVYLGSVQYVPGHLLTFLLLHLWKNYATYMLDGKYDNGLLAPTWEELFLALCRRPRGRKKPSIKALLLERKDPSSAVSTAMQHLSNPADSSSRDQQLSLKDIAQAFRQGIKTTSRSWFFKSYDNVFAGTDGVDFLVDHGYSRTREEAVVLGRRLQKELKMFQHVLRQHDFKDGIIFFSFLSYDNSEYTIKTHTPWGKGLFKALQSRSPPDLTPEEAHMEFPFASGKDHPRFTVKESLVIRSKQSRHLIAQQAEKDEPEDDFGVEVGSRSQKDVDNEGGDDKSLLSSPDSEHSDLSDSSVRLECQGSDDESIEEIIDSTQLYITKVLKPPPNQDMGFSKKGDKKFTDVLLEARHKMHQGFGHLFNDRPFKLVPRVPDAVRRDSMHSTSSHKRSRVARAFEGMTGRKRDMSPPKHRVSLSTSRHKRRLCKPTGDALLDAQLELAAMRDEYNKLLHIEKYSHPNPIVSKLAVIIQPVLEMVQVWLLFFRALYNVFTWQDSFLSFWVSLFGAVLVIILHLFPWRIFLGVVGVILVGPQNWLLRVVRSRRPGYIEPDFDTIIKKKKKAATKVEEVALDTPYFGSLTMDNQPVAADELDKSNVRPVVVPDTPLKYQRFYDWPPELEYTLVDPCDPPQSDPVAAAHLEADEKDRRGGSFSITAKIHKGLWKRSRKLRGAVAKGVCHIPVAAVSTVKKSPRVAFQGVCQVPNVAARGVKGVSKMPAAAMKVVDTRIIHRNKLLDLGSFDESTLSQI